MQPYRVLCLDGGGMRGLYTVGILENLTNLFNPSLKRKNADIGKAFDLICGTSTGSILAAGLVNGTPLVEIRDLYKDHGHKIFHTPQPHTNNKWKLGHWAWKHRKRSSSCADSLKSVITEAFGSITLATLFDKRKIGLCIPTVDARNHHPKVIKTPHNPQKRLNDNWKLADACMASAAAPIFLPIHKMTDPDNTDLSHLFTDGGLWANNPVLIGLTEALQQAHRGQKIQILSIGTNSTSSARPIDKTDRGIVCWKAGIGPLEMSMAAQEKGHDYTAKLLIQSLNSSGMNIELLRLKESPTSEDDMKVIGLDKADKIAIQTLSNKAHYDAIEHHSAAGNKTLNGHAWFHDIFSNLTTLN